MYDKENTKEQLIAELAELRKQNAELKTFETEHKKTEQELIFKTALLEAQAETTLDGILVVDDEGKSTMFNKRFGEMWNIPTDMLERRDDNEMLNYVLDQLKYPDKFINKVRYLYDHKDEKSMDEIKFKDGKTFDRWSAPLTDANGRYYGRIWYFRDITQHKLAEKAAKKARDDYLAITNLTVDIIVHINKEGSWTFLNDGACQFWGKPREELMGCPFADYLHPDDQEETMTVIQKMIESKKIVKGHVNRQKSPKGWRTVEWNTFPLFDESGNYVGMQVTGRDITERKKAENEIYQQKTFLESVLESLAHPFYVINVDDYSILMANSAAQQGDLEGLTCYALTHKVSKPCETGQHQCPIEEVKRTKKPVSVEHTHYDKDGNPRYIEVHGYPILDKEGNVIQMIEYALDITERMKAEETIKESETRYRTLFETAAEGILIVDIQTKKFKYANPAINKMLGYSAEELIGMGVNDIHPEEDLERVITEFEAQARGEKTLATDIPCLKKDGTIIYANISKTSALINGIECNIGFFTDITERKLLENQFIQAQKMESIGQLAGGIAHDFNNIMTVIIGNAQLALMSLTHEDPIIENIMEIKNSADRAVNLTRQLLAFSRRQIIEPRVVILNNTLLEMDKMFRRLIGEDIEFVTIPAEDLWPVKIDPGQIEQVLTNLVVNARDAMQKGGKLTIETANTTLDKKFTKTHRGTKPGDYVMMAVSDTGVGMDKETISHVFEPFFTTKEKDKGTGLGLSTCYGIVKQNGGNIWVYSEPGYGTTIKIYIPREFGETSSSIKRINNYLKGTETILVVEDEPKVLQVTVNILRNNGYTVYEAANGEEALRVAEKDLSWNIHLMLTDVIMPRMSGKELSEHFKIKNPDIKVLFVSGYTDNSIVRHGILEPGLEFLQKPFSPATLSQKVRQVLDG